MPAPFTIPNEHARLVGKKAARLSRPKDCRRVEPDSEITAVLFYDTDGGAAHNIGWHVQLRDYSGGLRLMTMAQFCAEWEIRK